MSTDDRLKYAIDPVSGERRWMRQSEIRAVSPPRPPRPFSWDRERRRLVELLTPMIEHELRESGCKRLYILGARECGLKWHSGLLGMASNCMADTLRKHIGRRWKNLGPCFAMQDKPPAETRQRVDDWYQDLVTVAAHELAHCLNWFPHWAVTNRCLTPGGKLFLLESATSADPSPEAMATEFSVPKWAGHDWKFIRCVLHLYHRIHATTGRPMPLLEALPWNTLGYPRPWDYLNELFDEIEELRHLPLSKVAMNPAPKKFLEVWSRDTGHDPDSKFVDGINNRSECFGR